MSESLKELLFFISTHIARDELLQKFEVQIPRYRKGMDLEEYGAACAVASGKLEAYEGLQSLICHTQTE